MSPPRRRNVKADILPLPQRADPPASFAEQVASYWDTLYASAIHWANGRVEMAEDLVQNTILKALERQHQYNTGHRADGGVAEPEFEGRRLRAWLMLMMKRIWIDDYRRGFSTINGQRIQREEVDIADLADVWTRPSAEDDALTNISIAEAMAEVGEMPAYYADILRLVVFEDMTYQEAASVVEIPLGTAMSGVHRARTRLRASRKEEPCD